MSAAIDARGAKERARIAARFIRSGVEEPGRAFSACFEMGDEREVLEHLRVMARRSPILRERWSRYLGVPMEVEP